MQEQLRRERLGGNSVEPLTSQMASPKTEISGRGQSCLSTKDRMLFYGLPFVVHAEHPDLVT